VALIAGLVHNQGAMALLNAYIFPDWSMCNVDGTSSVPGAGGTGLRAMLLSCHGRNVIFMAIGLACLVASERALAAARISVANSPIAMMVVPGRRQEAVFEARSLRRTASDEFWGTFWGAVPSGAGPRMGPDASGLVGGTSRSQIPASSSTEDRRHSEDLNPDIVRVTDADPRLFRRTVWMRPPPVLREPLLAPVCEAEEHSPADLPDLEAPGTPDAFRLLRQGGCRGGFAGADI
jgi:hypothetical protein